MLFFKNVPPVERVLRLFAGIAIIAVGWVEYQGQIFGYTLIASGIIAIMTGFVGFCPMCAMVGRKRL